MWRLMSAEEKKPYELRATGDRDRYKSEMGSYQSANMLKGNAMSQLGLADDSTYSQHGKKVKLEDGSSLGLDYSQLDPSQVELIQQQQQYLSQLQQSQIAAVMQAQQGGVAGEAAYAADGSKAGGSKEDEEEGEDGEDQEEDEE